MHIALFVGISIIIRFMRGQTLFYNQSGKRAAFGMYTSPRLKRDELSTTAGIAHEAKAFLQ